MLFFVELVVEFRKAIAQCQSIIDRIWIGFPTAISNHGDDVIEQFGPSLMYLISYTALQAHQRLATYHMSKADTVTFVGHARWNPQQAGLFLPLNFAILGQRCKICVKVNPKES